ncbi:MAG: c-type cytochrome [Janthinobacterium lividum]
MSKLIRIAAVAVTMAGTAAFAAPPPLPPGTPAYASLKGDATAGKAVFSVCKTCHVITPGQNRIGPSLYGVVGRPSGSVPGYTYSAANKNSHIVWTEPVLYEYLLAPQKYVPGTKMTYAGLKDAQKRADVIAYLKSKPTS